MSQWANIFRHLKNNKIDAFSPGQHEGDCTSPYVVIKGGEAYPFGKFSTRQDLYTLYCYVPKDKYSTLEPYVEQVETIMKGLEPMIRCMNTRTPSFFDDTVKGHMISTQYLNYVKL